ncbi:hypothetical protein BJV78DRAFT_1221486 [Lactifluus subvellereus]|nr:hypothetical protein BJV78DRAFT_1221486 [Lactifluus subvellereus]
MGWLLLFVVGSLTRIALPVDETSLEKLTHQSRPPKLLVILVTSATSVLHGISLAATHPNNLNVQALMHQYSTG